MLTYILVGVRGAINGSARYWSFTMGEKQRVIHYCANVE
jgi:hypothetical protein